tara:strand:- start:2343 stop:3149 length:807 start_codon:yes stop_codon:yes gene_type:complete
MPEALTIKDEPTPALSPDNQATLNETDNVDTGEPSKLAGKYDSVEALEKAHLELQKKLGDSEPAEDSGITESESEQEVESASATEIYGDLVGGRLDEAGIDFGDMNTRWQQTGELQAEDYSELEKAGFTRDMVDAYLQGAQFRKDQDTELSAKQSAQIMSDYGGESEYKKMTSWAESNFTEAEQSAFNKAIRNQDIEVVKLAIAGLSARYSANAEREPRLIGGKTARESTDKYESTAQIVAAMNDPLYKTDPAYRKKVENKIARSNVL